MQPEGEAAMAAALLDPSAPAPGGPRFAVHRNNVVAGLAERLGEAFPHVRRQVGARFFRAMAVEFARARPPRSPIPTEWGAEFPGWLEAFPPVAAYPWLPDLARLERAEQEALHAAEAEPLSGAALAGLAPEALAARRLRPHPAFRLVVSRFPMVSIRRGAEAPDLSAGEAALVRREGEAVLVEPVPPVRAAFLAALLEAPVLGALAEAAVDGGFDLSAELSHAFAAGLVAGLDPA